MIIRPYKIQDRQILIQTIDVVCAECEWMSTCKFMPTDQWLHSLVVPNCRNHVLFVVEEKKEIVGWCRVFPESCQAKKSVGELGIGLQSAYRNRKLGHKMLDAAYVWAFESGLKHIHLTVHENNNRALHLFQKFDFQFVAKEGNTFLMSSAVKSKEDILKKESLQCL